MGKGQALLVNDQEYAYLSAKILKLTGIDIGCYKGQQMRRRLTGFISKYDVPSVAVYCRKLEQDPVKVDELLKFLTINVSEFFRDVPQFEHLQNVILPALLKRSPRLNILSAACACGQEPYSIAILLEDLGAYRRHNLIAVDIDDDALARARRGGPYIPSEVRNVGQERLSKYFVETEEGYWVTEKIKMKVEFRKQNLLTEPFMDQQFNLVICRNVIIYFRDRVRDKLYEGFSNCLKEDGVLFLGGSEVMLHAADWGFAHMSPSFYRKLPAQVLVAAGS